MSVPETQPASERLALFHAPLRWTFFLYLTLVLCPLRFCAPSRSTLDNTWLFALNYAAAHHLLLGRDIFWTYGPLAYLLAPFAIGHNPAFGLAFQFLLWLLLAIALWDLLIRSGFRAPSVALFSFFLALSSLNYSQEIFPGNPLLPIALIFLVHYHLRGGTPRLFASLVLISLTPLFQFVGAVAAAGILAGFVLERLLRRPSGYIREVTLAVAVPFFVAIVGLFLTLGSVRTVLGYLQSSRELASGYSIAMSLTGTSYQISFVVAAFLLFGLALILLHFAKRSSGDAWFFPLVLAPPALLELRHGLVRQDPSHILQFFCFVALALALVALHVPWHRRFAVGTPLVTLFAFSTLWWAGAASDDPSRTLATLTGSRTASVVWQSLHYPTLVRSLQDAARRNSAESGLEPDLRAIVAAEPVAYLSLSYSNALGDNLNLSLLPVLQNYSVYTPALDRLNANFLDERGPRFLVYESQAIDARHTWLEAPATWLAVYRWYDSRALGPRSLLLERRSTPRSVQFQPIASQPATSQPASSQQVAFGQTIPIPASPQPVFWTLQCSPNSTGILRAALYRIPEVTLTVTFHNGLHRDYRVLLPVLNDAPSPAGYLPIGLPQLAAFLAPNPGQFLLQSQPPQFLPLQAHQAPQASTSNLTPARPEPHRSLQLSGPGLSSYLQPCQAQFFTTTP